jgi:hypothetical protein
MKVRKHTARERPHDAYFTAEFEIESSHPFWFRGNRAWALYLRDMQHEMCHVIVTCVTSAKMCDSKLSTLYNICKYAYYTEKIDLMKALRLARGH